MIIDSALLQGKPISVLCAVLQEYKEEWKAMPIQRNCLKRKGGGRRLSSQFDEELILQENLDLVYAL